MWYMWNGVGRMTSFYEIGGLILSGAVAENEYSSRSALEKKQRSEDIKLMRSVDNILDAHPKLREKDSLLEHWAKMASMPVRRGLSNVPEVISLRRRPRMLGVWGIQVYLEMIEANYQYFIQGESIEEW